MYKKSSAWSKWVPLSLKASRSCNWMQLGVLGS